MATITGCTIDIVDAAWTIPLWRASEAHPGIGHRFAPAGTTRGEFTWTSADSAIAAGLNALEYSAHRSSDGVWVLNHDATTGDQYTTDVAIASTPWATLQTLTRRYGAPEPMRRLDETLERYADLIAFVENKTYATFTEFFAILNAQTAATDRIVYKASGDSTSSFEAAKTHGYTTWGYFFGTAGASTLPTEWGPHMDWVGLSAGSTGATDQEWWDWCATRDIPVIGHVVRTAGDWTTMKAQGATMGMVNNDTVLPLT